MLLIAAAKGYRREMRNVQCKATKRSNGDGVENQLATKRFEILWQF
jgi:hypothetical protein